MSRYTFKLPDLGEGTVEAEIVSWRVKPGDTVAEDDVIVEVMTDKAAVEVPAQVGGRVVTTTGSPGDMVPVGSDLIVFETETASPDAVDEPADRGTQPRSNGAAVSASDSASSDASVGGERRAKPTVPAAGDDGAATKGAVETQIAEDSRGKHVSSDGIGAKGGRAHRGNAARVATSPAVRRKAHEAGVDLRELAGTGPNGRILRADLESFLAGRPERSAGAARAPAVRESDGAPATEEIKIIGLRRLIAQRMSEAKRNIPHFAYVEEVDVTELEALRAYLNRRQPKGSPALTYLPFLVSALVRVLREFPQCNALYDADRNVIVRHSKVHVGIATQTPDGLKVPVVRDAQSMPLSQLAEQMRRVTEAARTNKAAREELSGSTITVTSLGKLGGIASTPIINAPEVAIIGVNRAVERPMVHASAISIRRMMNLSSSFDHRFVDGHDAAAMIQALKERLEHPATIFME